MTYPAPFWESLDLSQTFGRDPRPVPDLREGPPTHPGTT